MHPTTAIAIVLAHFIGDWLFQSREMAINKSKSFIVLMKHLSILSITMLASSMTLDLPTRFCFLWIAMNLICHGIQDWFIWRIAGSHLMKSCSTNEDAYNKKFFWDIVGLDGALHYCTYFLSYWCLTQLA